MSFMAPMLPWLMAGSAALSGVQAMQAQKYQSAVAARNAQIESENLKRERLAAAEDMMQRDQSASAEMAAVMAELDASGISTDSGSFLRRKTSMQRLADRDRQRLAAKVDTQTQNSNERIAGFQAESAAAKPGAMGFLSTVLNVGTSYLSGASMYNNYKTGQMNLQNSSIVR